MTVNPGFKGGSLVPQAIQKIKDLKDVIKERGLNVEVSADGNVSLANIPPMVANGADILVSGSSGMFMKNQSLEESIKYFREAIREGLNERT